jgi:hypothetical protein
MSFVTDLIESIIDMPGEFAGVAAQGPIEGLLVLFGALFVTAPLAVFGYLAAGAVIDLLLPDSSEARHP